MNESRWSLLTPARSIHRRILVAVAAPRRISSRCAGQVDQNVCITTRARAWHVPSNFFPFFFFQLYQKFWKKGILTFDNIGFLKKFNLINWTDMGYRLLKFWFLLFRISFNLFAITARIISDFKSYISTYFYSEKIIKFCLKINT